MIVIDQGKMYMSTQTLCIVKYLNVLLFVIDIIFIDIFMTHNMGYLPFNLAYE